MGVNTFPELLAIITSFLCLFFAFFLLSLKAKADVSNLLIALFLIVFAIDTGGAILFKSFLYPDYPGLGLFVNSLIFFKFPLLYLYIRAVVYSDFRLRVQHLLHGLPFLIVFLLLLPDYYLASFEQKQLLLRNADPNVHALSIAYILLHIQILIYLIACYVVIVHYRKSALEQFSDARMFHHRWLLQLVIFISVTFVVSSLKNTTLFLEYKAFYDPIWVAVSLMALALITWMVFKALRYPELFKRVPSTAVLAKSPTKKPMEPSTLSDSDKKALQHLQQHMTEQEPYLNPSLSITDLAHQLGTSPKELSSLINHRLHQHFFDFVNTYRIERAKSILQDPGDEKVTVLEVLYEVGFNSKSSFNTAFKKHTGCTPTQFRRSKGPNSSG